MDSAVLRCDVCAGPVGCAGGGACMSVGLDVRDCKTERRELMYPSWIASVPTFRRWRNYSFSKYASCVVCTFRSWQPRSSRTQYTLLTSKLHAATKKTSTPRPRPSIQTPYLVMIGRRLGISHAPIASEPSMASCSRFISTRSLCPVVGWTGGWLQFPLFQNASMFDRVPGCAGEKGVLRHRRGARGCG